MLTFAHTDKNYSFKIRIVMKNKSIVFIIGAALLVSSCSNMSGAEGAYVGAGFGRVVGSTIGGLTNGWRGHEIGSLVGMVGGAVVGGVAASSAEKAQQRRMEKRVQPRHHDNDNYDRDDRYNYDDSGYDPDGRGDDRIEFENSYVANSVEPLEIREARIVEQNNDGVLTRGEECTVILDIVNNTNHPVFNISPIVEDVTGNKHVAVSPALSIEKIGPRQGIRYTATIKADRRLKNGEILLRVGVKEGQKEVKSQSKRFTVPTSKGGR